MSCCVLLVPSRQKHTDRCAAAALNDYSEVRKPPPGKKEPFLGGKKGEKTSILLNDGEINEGAVTRRCSSEVVVNDRRERRLLSAVSKNHSRRRSI